MWVWEVGRQESVVREWIAGCMRLGGPMARWLEEWMNDGWVNGWTASGRVGLGFSGQVSERVGWVPGWARGSEGQGLSRMREVPGPRGVGAGDVCSGKLGAVGAHAVPHPQQ